MSTMDHISLGRAGEAAAKSFLEEHHYQILEINWRYSRAEIDLIARTEDVLIFVEVKTQSGHRSGFPEDTVGTKKQQMLYDAATAYMEYIGHEGEVRFDVISVVFHREDEFTLRHIPDAFFPGLF